MDGKLNRFFEAFEPDAVQGLLNVAIRRVYGVGEWIFHENDPSDCAYLVIQGEISLIKAIDSGETEVLATVTDGDYFGEMGVIDEVGRSAGARSEDESTLLAIPAEPLLEVLRSGSGKAALHFFKHISAHLRITNARYVAEMVRKERMHAIGEMSNAIIHDFKNPMTSIQLGAEVIKDATNDKTILQACAIVSRQVDRMLNMAQELFEFSEGRTELRKRRVAVADLFREAELLNADFLNQHSVVLQIEADDTEVSLDRNRMLRVLQNLLGNAVDAFDGECGLIILKGTGVDTGLEIRVIDDGPGIPDRIRDRLFEPFVTARKRKGTGLGLAIVQSIIESHGGTISFKTETEVGTEFLIHLPED